MDWTVKTPTTLYGSDTDPSQLGTGSLGSLLGTNLPAGAVVSTTNPPNAVAGFLQATYNGKTGWVSQSALTQRTMTDTLIMVGFWGVVIWGVWHIARRV